MILTFNKHVTISSIQAADGSGATTENWVFTPTPNNGYVTATIPADGGVTVHFNSNFANITAITITRSGGGSTFFLIDNVALQAVLPVELTSFTASTNGSSVTLNWHTATEMNNYGFEIERRTVNSEQSIVENWQIIGFVEGAGMVTHRKNILIRM